MHSRTFHRTAPIRFALAVLLLLAATFAGAEVIDDFETAQATLTDSGSSVVNGAVILGSNRELEIELVEGTSVTTEASVGSLFFDATAGGDSIGAATAVWDADANTTVFDGDGLGGVNLTDNNESAFRIQVEQADAGTQILLEVFTNDGNSSKAGLRLPAVAATQNFFISYADFITNLGTGADFADVGAIVLRVLGENVTAEISHFETVGPTLTVTKIDIDPNDDMDFGTDPVLPGDTIRYQVQITNDGGLAEQVDMVDTVDTNTTFTADSLTATPVALVDTVAVLGNVTRTVADPGVLANDQDPDGDALFVRITNSDTMSAEGGTIAWNDAGLDNLGEGGFQYFPPAGFRGVDSFSYELEDADGQTAAGLVTVILDRIIWFVDDNHGGSQDGTLANPFLNFADLDDTANDVDRDGDIIFVFAHSGGGYTHAGLELEPGQSLIGEGEGLTVDGNVIVPAGASALIHAPDAGAGTTHGATLTMNNTIRGVTFGDTEGHAITGSNFGTLTVSNTTVTGAGGILDVDNGTLDVVLASSSSSAGPGFGIDLDSVGGSFDAGSTTITGGVSGIRVANGAGGTTFDFGVAAISGVATGLDLIASPMASFSFDSLDVTSSGTALLIHSAGTVNIGGVGNTVETTAGAAIDAQLTSMGSGGWTFDSVTSDNSPTLGIFLNSMTGGDFLVTGATDINESMSHGIAVNAGGARTYDFGSTDISGTGSLAPLSDGRGVSIHSGNSMSSFVFDSLNVTTDNGHALVAHDVGLLAIAGATNLIVATNGNGLWIERTTVDEVPGAPVTGITFATLSSTNSTLDGINLQSVTGSVTGNAGSITGASDAAVRIGSATNNSGGASNVTYAGSITNTQDLSVLIQERNGGAVTLSGNINDTGTGILVTTNNNGTANTITFSGSSKVLSTGANTAVLLDNNDDATVSFTNGGLDIDTSGAVTAFNAINGGTVQVTGTGNSVSTAAGSGTAVHIEDTTIGSGGVTFQSVSTGAGTTPGLFLDDTGSIGFFLVEGSGDGVVDCRNSAADCAGGTISSRAGADDGADGVLLNNVRNVFLNEMNISSNNRNGIFGAGVNGFTLNDSRLIGNTNQDNPNENAINFDELTGTGIAGTNPTWLRDVRVENSTEHNVEIRNTTGTLTDFVVEDSLFSNNGASGLAGTHINFLSQGSASMTLTTRRSEFIGNRVAGALTASGIFADGQSTAALGVTVRDSFFEDNNNAINVSHTGSGNVTFDITGNGTAIRPIVGNLSAAEAAGAGGASTAINVVMSTSYSGTATGVITNNFIGSAAITESGSATGRGIVADMDGSGTLRVDIMGNTVRQTDSNGIRSWTQDADGGDIFIRVTGNALSDVTSNGIYLRSRDGAANTMCAVVSGNTAGASVTSTHIRLREDTGAVSLETGTSASTNPTTVLQDNNPGASSWDGDSADATTPVVVSNGTCGF